MTHEGQQMFDVRPDEDNSGFAVDVSGGVPGMRIAPDGSVLSDAAARYINTRSQPVSAEASIWEKIRDPAWVAPRVMATMDGAISVIPGTWNAIRAIGRASGALGKEEAQRFDQEMEVVAKGLGHVARHPEPVARAAGVVGSELAKDPLLPYHAFGRGLAGSLLGVGPLRLGPLALVGDALRAVEKGHNFVDSAWQGVKGTSVFGR